MALPFKTAYPAQGIENMPHIDYFFSPISPFTYLADRGLEKIVQKHSTTVAYKLLDVIALFSRTGGTPPPQRHPSRQEYRLQELQRQSKKKSYQSHLSRSFFQLMQRWPHTLLLRRKRWAQGTLGHWHRAFYALAGPRKKILLRTM
jgi:2-hydroxychromene-2-carboxylate isomerase